MARILGRAAPNPGIGSPVQLSGRDTRGLLNLIGEGLALFAIAQKVHSAWILHARFISDWLLSLEQKSAVNKLQVKRILLLASRLSA